MLDAFLEEPLPVVLLLIEADDGGDPEFLKDRGVVLGGEGAVVVSIILVRSWARESHEFARDYPIQVTIINDLVVLVL